MSEVAAARRVKIQRRLSIYLTNDFERDLLKKSCRIESSNNPPQSIFRAKKKEVLDLESHFLQLQTVRYSFP